MILVSHRTSSTCCDPVDMATSILNRLWPSSPPGNTPAEGAGEQHFSFAAELPGSHADQPLWRMSVDLIEKPEGEGARLRLRVRMQTAVGEALTRATERAKLHRTSNHAQMLGSDSAAPKADALMVVGGGPLSRVGRRVGTVVSDVVERGLRQPFVQKLLDPLKTHDINTWFEVQASTAPLDAGANALLPEAEQLAKVGIALRQPDPRGGPLIESWATPGNDDRSFALVSVVRMAKEHLPPGVAALLGDQPFHLAAAMVNVVEPHRAIPAPKPSEPNADAEPNTRNEHST